MLVLKDVVATGDMERANRRTAGVSSVPVVPMKRERQGKEEGEDEGNTISQYELQRLERIKRNNAFMASLSLDSLNKVSTIQSG